MFEKALFRYAFWFPFAMTLAGLTINLVDPLTMLSMWGTFHIPATATDGSVSAAFAMELLVFLSLLAIPKIVIYFNRAARRSLTLRKALWNSATYLLLPILIWVLFFMSKAQWFGWFLVALAAWTEALQIAVAPRLPPKLREHWRLD